MGLNDTQSSMRPHISFFGKRNAGKSSVVNAVTGQNLSIVSDTLGTTTDPVQKAMEILPLGPVVIIDTPGFDDEGELGELRIQKAKRVLNKTDIAVLVVDITKGISKTDETLISIFKDKNIPYIIAYNKTDIADEFNESSAVNGTLSENEIYVSAKTNGGINDLREKIAAISSRFSNDKLIIGDRLKKGDIVILVIPIDESAPKGRIILPQQNVLRECLDAGASALCVQPGQLDGILNSLNKKPRIVITDSQAFGEVSNIVPDDICLTSFSILLAQYK
ncbi:MAG TPA: [FeFe] hydrogenase H-cluster maturation GTPase HydF, partial [Candidatus Alectryocaccobium stercorigallinarum]|nr:[FeFe] hydrogenase H-cluster maturation GTPase HydF [Candidatus Alectryocaccobium stercorigallinarum]